MGKAIGTLDAIVRKDGIWYGSQKEGQIEKWGPDILFAHPYPFKRVRSPPKPIVRIQGVEIPNLQQLPDQ